MISRSTTGSSEKLTARDYRFIFICIALASILFIIVAKYFYIAFPEASINIEVTREESRALAERFLTERGEPFQAYRHSAIFDYDYLSKIFLEKEMGLEQAKALLGTKIKLWRWQHRWFRPLQKEEFRVDVTPRGEVVQFQHLIRQQAPGANLTPQAARAIAEEFLTEVMHNDPAALEFVEVESKQRLNRTDHTFTWRDTAFSFRGSSYRFEVIVQGDRVGGYRESLKPPEKWIREYRQLRSLNQTAGTVDMTLTVLLFLGLAVTLIRRIRMRDIRLKTALAFGLVAAGLDFLSSLNVFPLGEFDYQTTESYGSFFTHTLLGSFFSALGSGALIFILTAAAESLYRERYADKLSLTNLFSWRSLRTKRVFLGLILGLTLTPCFLAYQTLFYLLANKLGAWSPADVPLSALLSTSFPWAYVLLSGFFPAVSEEFLFRMFSIPFLEKWLKSPLLALILAGFIWGFGHAAYPNQPFYIRGVEVGLAGMIAGIIMIRFGILPLLIWHYTIDAAYSALLMLRSDDLYFVLSGSATAFICFLPLLIALVSYLRSGRFEDAAELTNQREEQPPRQSEEAPSLAIPAAPLIYQPLSNKRVLVGLLAVGILSGFYWLNADRLGDVVDYRITGGEAKRLADEFLQKKSIDTSQFRSVISARSNFDSLAAKYILTHRDSKTLNALYEHQFAATLWVVRYFTPGEQQEYRVYVDPRRKSVYSFQQIIDEEAPGADLTADQALGVATAFLQARGMNPAEYELVESSSQKRPARRDYRLIWRAREGDPRNIADATFRLSIEIQGDQVSRFRRFLKLPEDWVRQRREQTALTAMRFWARLVIWGLLAFLAITTFLNGIRRGLIRWRQTIFLATGATALYALYLLNDLPLVYQNYNTSVDPGVHLVNALANAGIALVLFFVAAALVLGLGTTLYPQALSLLRQPNRSLLARDAVICSLILMGGFFGIGQVMDLLLERFPAAAAVSGPSPASHIDTALPVVSHLVFALLATTLMVVALGLIAQVVRQHLKKPAHLALAFIVVVPLLVSDRAKTPDEFLLSLAILGLSLGAILAFAYGFLRNNILAYPVSGFLSICVHDGAQMVTQSATFFIANGAILLTVAAMVVLWLLASQRAGPTNGQPSAIGFRQVEGCPQSESAR